jgi:hypothetical protein
MLYNRPWLPLNWYSFPTSAAGLFRNWEYYNCLSFSSKHISDVSTFKHGVGSGGRSLNIHTGCYWGHGVVCNSHCPHGMLLGTWCRVHLSLSTRDVIGDMVSCAPLIVHTGCYWGHGVVCNSHCPHEMLLGTWCRVQLSLLMYVLLFRRVAKVSASDINYTIS